jgi:hypothetical protein
MFVGGVLLKKGVKNDEELYCDCWLNKWKCNLGDLKQWVDILFVLFSFAESNMTINSIGGQQMGLCSPIVLCMD